MGRWSPRRGNNFDSNRIPHFLDIFALFALFLHGLYSLFSLCKDPFVSSPLGGFRLK